MYYNSVRMPVLLCNSSYERKNSNNTFIYPIKQTQKTCFYLSIIFSKTCCFSENCRPELNISFGNYANVLNSLKGVLSWSLVWSPNSLVRLLISNILNSLKHFI